MCDLSPGVLSKQIRTDVVGRVNCLVDGANKSIGFMVPGEKYEEIAPFID